MFTIAVTGQKGGVGKSTIAINLLAYFQKRKGYRVLLIDADDQATAANWCYSYNYEHLDEFHAKKLPTNKSLYKYIKNKQYLKEYNQEFDFIIVDTDGKNSKRLDSILRLANVALFPMGASEFDLQTLELLGEKVGIAKQKSKIDEATKEPWPANPDLHAFVIPAKLKEGSSVKEVIEYLEHRKIKRIPSFKHLDWLYIKDTRSSDFFEQMSLITASNQVESIKEYLQIAIISLRQSYQKMDEPIVELNDQTALLEIMLLAEEIIALTKGRLVSEELKEATAALLDHFSDVAIMRAIFNRIGKQRFFKIIQDIFERKLLPEDDSSLLTEDAISKLVQELEQDLFKEGELKGAFDIRLFED